MDADLKGCLNQIDLAYKSIEHNGKTMTKKQVKAVLEYGITKEYILLSQISDEEVNKILFMLENSEKKEEVAPPNQLNLF